MKYKVFMFLAKQNKIFYRAVTSPLRVLPNFIIIGAQKCGTTSLYNYLMQHPCMLPSFRKELNFFDLGYQRGLLWYRAYFPTYAAIKSQSANLGSNVITGEATPQYLFHPLASKRVWETLPKVKLIVILRNPVTRAYSHYNHVKSRGHESLSFEDALEREKSILDLELREIEKNPYHRCIDFLKYSYVSRGIYADQLERWMKLFPKEQLMIFKYEDFTADPVSVYKETLKFLSLPEWDLKDYESFNSGRYSSGLESATKDKLVNFFEPYNHRLYNLLGVDFDW